MHSCARTRARARTRTARGLCAAIRRIVVQKVPARRRRVARVAEAADVALDPRGERGRLRGCERESELRLGVRERGLCVCRQSNVRWGSDQHGQIPMW